MLRCGKEWSRRCCVTRRRTATAQELLHEVSPEPFTQFWKWIDPSTTQNRHCLSQRLLHAIQLQLYLLALPVLSIVVLLGSLLVDEQPGHLPPGQRLFLLVLLELRGLQNTSERLHGVLQVGLQLFGPGGGEREGVCAGLAGGAVSRGGGGAPAASAEDVGTSC